MSSRAWGDLGEDNVCAHLAQQGIEVLDRNVRLAHGELDIVAREGETYVFIEVKARTSARFGTPAEAVDSRKRRRILSAATCYAAMHGWMDCRIRFDIIEQTPGKIRHIKGAFDASGK